MFGFMFDEIPSQHIIKYRGRKVRIELNAVNNVRLKFLNSYKNSKMRNGRALNLFPKEF